MLAIISDDGCTVSVKLRTETDDKYVPYINKCGHGQKLEKKAFETVPFLFKPDTLYDVKVDYSQVFYTPKRGKPDIDGATLYACRIPVKIRVNETDKQEDDLVAVSKSVDEDLATDFSVKVSGVDGLTAELSLKDANGSLKFKDKTLNFPNGTEAKTKLWGVTHSSAKDKTIIVVTLKKDGKELGKIEEAVTVFKGVRIEFGGNYYINVDTRDWRRRPWDGRVDPKPNTKFNLTKFTGYMDVDITLTPTAIQLADYKKAVDQDATFGYQSAISFNENDNSAIPHYKPWKGALKVKIDKVSSLKPPFDLTDDPMINEKIRMKKGVLDGLPDGAEKLLDPQIEVSNYFSLDKTTVTKSIKKEREDPQSVSERDILDRIDREMGKGYDELSTYFKTRPKDYASFSGRRYEWKNDSFEVQKGTSIKNSFAAKSIRGEKENREKVEAKWIFGGWNEFKFVGELEGATIETK